MEICKHLPTPWVLPLQGIVVLGSFNFVAPCDKISQKLKVVMMAKKKKKSISLSNIIWFIDFVLFERAFSFIKYKWFLLY